MKNSDVLFQASIQSSLPYAMRRGSTRIADMLEHGNIGLGTGEFPGGELIIVDGDAWEGRCDDTVIHPDLDTRIPFGFITEYMPQVSESINGGSLNDLMKIIDVRIDRTLEGHNYFYMLRIDGVYSNITYRTGIRYTDTDGKDKSRKEFQTYEKLSGTIVGIWSPAYVRDLNIPGWHFHFASEDRSHVGHLMDVESICGELGIQKLAQWMIDLSTDPEFAQIPYQEEKSR